MRCALCTVHAGMRQFSGEVHGNISLSYISSNMHFTLGKPVHPDLNPNPNHDYQTCATFSKLKSKVQQ